MKAIKVGLVGAGYVSAHHLRALKSLDSIEIVGIADLNFERAKSVAARFGVARACPQVEELYALSPEAVHILTPPSSHAALAIQALQAGMHVLVEKPMAESVDECDRMIAAASSAGRTLGVVHSARLDPIVLRGADEVRSGKIGEVISLDFLRSSDYPAWEGGGKLPPHYAKGSYPLQDLGIHALSIAEAFLGEANTAKIAFRSTHSDPNLLFDEWTATVECERGPARLYISWNVRPVRSQIIVHGTRGVMYIDTFLQTCHSTRVLPGPKFGSLVACELRNSAANLYEVPWNVFRFLTGRLAGAPGIQTNIREFYEAVEAGRPVQTSPSEGRRLVALMASVSEEADCKRKKRGACS
jgi:predicted dehydrogenase